MNNLKDRIQELMTARRLTRQQFTDLTGISPASLSNIFNEKSKPTLNHVQAIIAAFPSVSPAWLISGAGEMFLSSSAPYADVQTGKAGHHSAEPLMIDFDNPPASQPVPTVAKPALLPARDKAQAAQERTNAAPAKEEKRIEIRTRQITEIRIFYDDQTWETFVPKR
ncbi:MAG: helix-turn-helix domain-containing protein [Prevotella sp.]|nr:helix-turn-helix domain-containing protein [Prevotella sp.]